MAKRKSRYADMFTLRSDGRYMATYCDETGRRKCIYNRDPEKLFHALENAKEALLAPKPVYFKDIADEWQEENWEKIRLGTKSCYAAPLERAKHRFDGWEIKDITTKDLNAHLLFLASQRLSKSSVKAQRVTYSQIFKYAIAKGILRDNPAAYAEIPSSVKQPVKRCAPEEEVIQKIKDNAETAYFGLFAMFVICTGFRRGEALAVRWRDIDFGEDGWVHCNGQIQSRGSTAKEVPPKTNAGYREVPLLPALRNVLLKPDGASDDDFIFGSPENMSKPMPECTFDRKWKHYCKDMGFIRLKSQEKRVSKQGHEYIHEEYETTLVPHELRHGYATMLFEAGVDEQAAMYYMGHSNITITRAVYTDLRKRQKTKSTEKLLAYSAKMLG